MAVNVDVLSGRKGRKNVVLYIRWQTLRVNYTTRFIKVVSCRIFMLHQETRVRPLLLFDVCVTVHL